MRAKRNYKFRRRKKKKRYNKVEKLAFLLLAMDELHPRKAGVVNIYLLLDRRGQRLLNEFEARVYDRLRELAKELSFENAVKELVETMTARDWKLVEALFRRLSKKKRVEKAVKNDVLEVLSKVIASSIKP